MLKNEKLLKFLGKKIVRFIILLIFVILLSFILIDMSPINPVKTYIANLGAVSPEKIAILESYWGVNEPITSKMFNWLANMIHLDFGTSLIYRAPVLEVIEQKFVASLVLMLTSWVFSGVIGFLLGVIAGFKKDTIIDKAIKVYCYILQSAPTFWIALLFLMVFSVYLGWFPTGLGVPVGTLSENVSFWDWLHRLILPMITLSVVGIASITLFTRDKLIDVMNSDYFLFAKARGESGWNLILRHGVRNILLPAITLQFLGFSELFGGAVLVEQIFTYPGIGQAAVAAGLRSDVPLLLGIVIFSAIFVYCGNLIADVLYNFVDPRIREGEEDGG
ncbi:MAG: ABC transporter permease [Methanobrevibacter sp.]|uniref:ABC transporter permease n=1 Tax=Methanobrevibacter sp. TaxID=66852 RepID=UPI00257A3F02|nr:ABC transporter permease [Methanobrevibacter sp.]MBR2665126.1 ABC transporter permease [Methanobrevibacter sp.]MBR3196867.1 ABC transporter permease [Methanobrevibacter sp.]MBR6927940.1 ABC transporter permease [Methanobrevibacter sp.]MBR7051199.1 ABC transporter permease [Methanobrevibacter sp.]